MRVLSSCVYAFLAAAVHIVQGPEGASCLLQDVKTLEKALSASAQAMSQYAASEA